MPSVKQLLKSKTLWVGLATLCTGIGMYFSGESDMSELVTAGVGVLMIVLRFFTSTPVKGK